MNKNDFMAACRDGGSAMEQALRMLDRSFHVSLQREAQRVVRDGELARDLVQDTFIKVWRRCATFHGDSELLPWIRSILRHTILDRLRQPTRELPMESVMDDHAVMERVRELDGAASIDAPDEAARAAESAACFERCWQRFAEESPQHAVVIQWIVEDGLSGEEIAAVLQRSPGASREYVSQCRKRARVYLAEWHRLAFEESP